MEGMLQRLNYTKLVINYEDISRMTGKVNRLNYTKLVINDGDLQHLIKLENV